MRPQKRQNWSWVGWKTCSYIEDHLIQRKCSAILHTTWVSLFYCTLILFPYVSVNSNHFIYLSLNINIPVIDAWSRRSGADTAERAENILRRLLNNYELTKNRFLRPDVITYTAVMKSYVNKPNGGEKAIAILEEMNNEYKNGNARAIPDVKALSVAMDACAKSGLTEEAERILNDVDDSQKNAILFNTIMSGYKSEGRGEEAEAILRRMINLEQSGFRRCSPDMISYTLCIEAWGNSTSDEKVSRSRALLDESITRYQNGNNSCKPSNVTFNATASCISNCDDPDRVTQVLSLFETMEAIGLEPELVSFNIL